MTFEEFKEHVNTLETHRKDGSVNIRHQIAMQVEGVVYPVFDQPSFEVACECVSERIMHKLYESCLEAFAKPKEPEERYTVDDLRTAYYMGQTDLHICRSFSQALKEIDRRKEQR